MSIAPNKNLNPLSNLLINCISARSSPETLSRKVECTFLFSNFLNTGLSILQIISFLTVSPEVDLSTSEVDFLSKIYRPSKQVRVDIHHIYDFYQY